VAVVAADTAVGVADMVEASAAEAFTVEASAEADFAEPEPASQAVVLEGDMAAATAEVMAVMVVATGTAVMVATAMDQVSSAL
jgi:hypothetical protein